MEAAVAVTEACGQTFERDGDEAKERARVRDTRSECGVLLLTRRRFMFVWSACFTPSQLC